ncbi:unnamed protein product [Closterium sp. NIES-64]|nr:unnamed protein product [Closterium sp. NIES-64]
MAASVEAAVKLEEEIVIMEAAAVNGGDGDDVNTFAAAIVVEDEAVNAKCVGFEVVKGDIMVKGSKANATAKGQVLKEDERVEGYETREVLGVKMPRRSERHKKISQGLDVKALNYKAPHASMPPLAFIPPFSPILCPYALPIPPYTRPDQPMPACPPLAFIAPFSPISAPMPTPFLPTRAMTSPCLHALPLPSFPHFHPSPPLCPPHSSPHAP